MWPLPRPARALPRLHEARLQSCVHLLRDVEWHRQPIEEHPTLHLGERTDIGRNLTEMRHLCVTCDRSCCISSMEAMVSVWVTASRLLFFFPLPPNEIRPRRAKQEREPRREEERPYSPRELLHGRSLPRYPLLRGVELTDAVAQRQRRGGVTSARCLGGLFLFSRRQ